MGCSGSSRGIRYNGLPAYGGASLTYNSGDRYQDPTNLVTAYYSDVDASPSRPPNRLALKITHAGVGSIGSFFSVFQATPVINIRGNQFVGFESPVDRSCGERLCVKLTHMDDSFFVIDMIRLQAAMRHRRQPATTPG